MGKVKLFLFLFIIVGLAGIISASTIESIGPVKAGTDVELIQSGDNGTALLEACNISFIRYPNSSIIFSDIEMTKRTADFNYTLTADYTTAIGTYPICGFCTLGTEKVTWCYNLIVTVSGTTLETSEGIIYLVILCAIVFLFLLCLWGSIVIPFSNNIRDEEGYMIGVNDLKYLKVFLMVMDYILLMWIFGLFRSISENYATLNVATNIFNYAFWIMLSFLFPLIIIILVAMIVVWTSDKKIKRLLDRGIKI